MAKEFSIYRRCSWAVRVLLADPSQRITSVDAPEGVFTEIDVLLLAARPEHWNQDQIRVAFRDIANILSAFFRSGKIARFGPVLSPGMDEPDYVRLASKIVYARADGPASIRTPNGTFPRLMSDGDQATPGRKAGSNRDDFVLWKDASPQAMSLDQHEIARLRIYVEALEHQLAEVTAERDQLLRSRKRDEARLLQRRKTG